MTRRKNFPRPEFPLSSSRPDGPGFRGWHEDPRLLAVIKEIPFDPDPTPHALWKSRLVSEHEGGRLVSPPLYMVVRCHGEVPEGYGTAHPQIVGSGLTIQSARKMAREEYWRHRWDRWGVSGLLRALHLTRRNQERARKAEKRNAALLRDIRYHATADESPAEVRVRRLAKRHRVSESTVYAVAKKDGITFTYKR